MRQEYVKYSRPSFLLMLELTSTLSLISSHSLNGYLPVFSFYLSSFCVVVRGSACISSSREAADAKIVARRQHKALITCISLLIHCSYKVLPCTQPIRCTMQDIILYSLHILIRVHRKKEYASLVGYILILMGGLSQPNPD
jgi:hypothetical protein